jgi:hypothetical protein
MGTSQHTSTTGPVANEDAFALVVVDGEVTGGRLGVHPQGARSTDRSKSYRGSSPGDAVSRSTITFNRDIHI